MNSCSISRRAQFIVIGQRREQVSLHSFCLSLSLSLSLLWSFQLGIECFLLPSYSSSSSSSSHLPLNSLVAYVYTTVFDNTPFHTCSTCYAVLQCTTLSNITITIDIDENVFVHMQWHANEERKELIFRVYCICTYIYTCIYIQTKKNYHIA